MVYKAREENGGEAGNEEVQLTGARTPVSTEFPPSGEAGLRASADVTIFFGFIFVTPPGSHVSARFPLRNPEFESL